MKIGIFFGGQSREREISFAGGRTVFDNLSKDIFEPVPVFVDSLGTFILLDWSYIYKGSIRDFYPPVAFLPESPNSFQVYIESLENLTNEQLESIASSVGRKILPSQFAELMDFAFLALHGPYGEDGNIQGILEWYQIPYSGAGILSSAIGINKIIQKDLIGKAGINRPDFTEISRSEWENTSDKAPIFKRITDMLGFPVVVKSPNQGSSIGVSVVRNNDLHQFVQAVERSLFTVSISSMDWKSKTTAQQILFIKELTDIRVGIGLPVVVKDSTICHPEDVLKAINAHFSTSEDSLLLENTYGEEFILFEKFVHGKEFSCIVVQDDSGRPISLPPTEIIKGEELFDYRSKYLPGMTRKVTPIGLPQEDVERIRKACETLFTGLYFNVYARIDGFITSTGEIFLNDPNTTSGMLPSSFFFHQAAEIGLNPSQFLTYIVRTSLAERIKSGKAVSKAKKLLNGLDQAIITSGRVSSTKLKVGVIMGGYSSERHISVESGRNIYEKLASSTKYFPIPIFLTGSDAAFELFQLPINILLKDNADDIKEKVMFDKPSPVLEHIRSDCGSITAKYSSNSTFKAQKIGLSELAEMVDVVFIALHGRPGEDGALQKELEKFHIPYNGSGIESSATTINKYLTNEILGSREMHVARHTIVEKATWLKNNTELFERIEKDFAYPFIAKPFDDGCSSAVKKIKSRQALNAYCLLAFRETEEYDQHGAEMLGMRFHEEFPQKQSFMIEDLINKGDCDRFLEVTGGMLTHVDEQGMRTYEMFEPSETLASGEVLSLEEKFLAGEGQNITPARYGSVPSENRRISQIVQAELKKVCEILNVEGYCRIDAFVKIWNWGEVQVVIIEVNSLPGMTPATCIFHQCALSNYKPFEFIDAILTYGIQKNNVMSHV